MLNRIRKASYVFPLMLLLLCAALTGCAPVGTGKEFGGEEGVGGPTKNLSRFESNLHNEKITIFRSDAFFASLLPAVIVVDGVQIAYLYQNQSIKLSVPSGYHFVGTTSGGLSKQFRGQLEHFFLVTIGGYGFGFLHQISVEEAEEWEKVTNDVTSAKQVKIEPLLPIDAKRRWREKQERQ